MGKYREAALEFRRIVDEKPQAMRVRLELDDNARARLGVGLSLRG